MAAFDDDDWAGGPLLELQFRFRQTRLTALPTSEVDAILPALGIQGPFEGIEELRRGKRFLGDWRVLPSSIGLWILSERERIGVTLIPSRWPTCDLILGMPPRQIERAFGKFPWDLRTQWVTEDVIRLHTLLLACIDRLHRALPLKATLIQEEGWTYCLRDSSEGIMLNADVATGLKLKGKREGDLLKVHLP